MSESIQELIERHHPFYEVSPYYIALEKRERGKVVAKRQIQAGFDIDVYGDNVEGEWMPGGDYAQAYAIAKKMVEAILPISSESCHVEIIPFPATVFLDRKRRLLPQGMLRIRISHGRGLEQPAGPSEERALNEIQEQLHAIGLKPQKGTRR
jgi:hypothetical protein